MSAVNPAAFLNGRDLETDAQRKQRFGAFVTNLARGTISALEFGALTTVLNDSNGVEIERVALVQVIEPYVADNTQPIAIVDLYIHNGVGNTSSALVAQCQQIIDGFTDSNGNKVPGYKAAGVPVNISAATEVPLNVTSFLSPAAGFDGPTLATAAEGALSTYILGLGIGAPFVFSDAIVAVKAISGVADFVFVSPTANDAVAAASAKFMPGAIAVTPVSGVLSPPVNVAPPAITGVAEESQTLTAEPGVWLGTPTPTVMRQWNSNGAAISGATGSTYAVAASDVGHAITVTETASNTLGQSSATSAPTAAVAAT